MPRSKTRTTPEACPKCGSAKVAAILYGLPIFDNRLERQLEEGKVVLGGCCVTGNDPQWMCQDCKHGFGQV